jgi:hypothetical protein
MTPKNTPPSEDGANKTEPEPAGEHKRRRHGYRGYPNNPDIGGDIHIGTGFAGVGPGGNELPARSSLLSEKTRESVAELGEEEEDEK